MQKYIIKLAGPFEGPIRSKRPQKSYTNQSAACCRPVRPFRARSVAVLLRAESKLVATGHGPFRIVRVSKFRMARATHFSNRDNHPARCFFLPHHTFCSKHAPRYARLDCRKNKKRRVNFPIRYLWVARAIDRKVNMAAEKPREPPPLTTSNFGYGPSRGHQTYIWESRFWQTISAGRD